jgi:hypothetical protein
MSGPSAFAFPKREPQSILRSDPPDPLVQTDDAITVGGPIYPLKSVEIPTERLPILPCSKAFTCERERRRRSFGCPLVREARRERKHARGCLLAP